LYFNDFFREIQKHKNEEVLVSVLRNYDTISVNVEVPEAGKMWVCHSVQ